MKKNIDKKEKGVYVWYSGATNVTGEKLAQALGADHGDKKPVLSKTSLILCWGTKTKEDVGLGEVLVLNHPNNIRDNRNKLMALEKMRNGKVSVPPFCTDISNISTTKNTGVYLPVIGRTRYHQGGKGFWSCPTMTHVKEAINEGATYFQNLIEIKDEYRVHIVDGMVVYVAKKVKRTVEEMEEAYIKHEMDRQKSLAEKNNDTLDEKTMEIFLRRQAKKFAQDGANMLIRSNRLGWKFVRVKTISKEKELINEAIKACNALGLVFGAVDCCIDVSDKPLIIEVNSGPGLEETTFDVWVEALKKLMDKNISPVSKNPIKNIIDKALSNTAPKKPEKSGSTKEQLMTKFAMAQEMIEQADESETEVLDKIFKRMFGN